MITKPQNVCVMRDVMCSGYVAGGNTRFFGQPSGGFSQPVLSSAVTEAMDHRLSFHNDAEGEYDSMLAFAAPYGDGAKRDQVISITPRLLPWEVTKVGGATKDYFPGNQINFDRYKTEWRLDTIHFGEDVRAAENMEFISQGELPARTPAHPLRLESCLATLQLWGRLRQMRPRLFLLAGSMNNGLCFVGPHRKYNPFSNQYHELVPGQGHFGPDAIPGVRCLRHRTHRRAVTALCVPRLATNGARYCRTRGGAGARPSRSSRHATRWSRSRSPRTRRCT